MNLSTIYFLFISWLVPSLASPYLSNVLRAIEVHPRQAPGAPTTSSAVSTSVQSVQLPSLLLTSPSPLNTNLSTMSSSGPDQGSTGDSLLVTATPPWRNSSATSVGTGLQTTPSGSSPSSLNSTTTNIIPILANTQSAPFTSNTPIVSSGLGFTNLSAASIPPLQMTTGTSASQSSPAPGSGVFSQSSVGSVPSSNAASSMASVGASITSITTAAPSSSSSGLNVLPVTAVVSNSQTASFSEDQDPSFAKFSGTTSVSITMTASASGKSTTAVVPVIIGVGGFYWRPLPFPDLTFPSIQLPKLPPIPKFPCFKLFDIFSIDCPSSDSSGGGKGGGGNNDNPPENSNPPPGGENPSPSPTERPASKSASISSTTSSSSSNSSSSSSSACSVSTPVTSSAITAQADDSCDASALYVVWPEDRTNTAQNAAISAELARIVGDPTAIDTSSWPNFGTAFWRASLTHQQAQAIYGFPGVASVTAECTTNCPDPTQTIKRQPNAAPEMVFISQQSGVSVSTYKGNYLYDDSAGQGVNVYILDTGAYTNLPEFTQGQDIVVGGRNVNQRARFILVGPDADGVERRDDAGMDLTRTFGVSHGTCMLSKVVGHLYGVAKKANPILVRVPRGDVLNGWLLPGGQKPTDYLKGVLMVLDDVQPGQPGAGIPAVLSMSFGIPRVSNGKWTLPDFMDPTKDDSTKFEEEFRDALKAVVNIGVHIVTTSGNDGKSTIDGWPANFGKTNGGQNYIPELLVSGSVDVIGQRSFFENSDPAGLPNILAPGQGITCADATITNPSSYKSGPSADGTSPAGASIAGLIAYLIKMNQDPYSGIDVSTPLRMKNYIVEKLLWARPNSNVKAIWNGVTLADVDNSPDFCPIAKRDINSTSPSGQNCSEALQPLSPNVPLSPSSGQSSPVTSAAGGLGSSLEASQSSPLSAPTGSFSVLTSIVSTFSSSAGLSTALNTTLTSNTQLGAVTASVSSPVAKSPPPASEVSTTSTVNSAAAGIAAAILSVAVLPPSSVSSIQSQVSLSSAAAGSSSPAVATTNSATSVAPLASDSATSPAPAFQTGTCRVHIYEVSSECNNVATAPVSGYIQLYDGTGNSLYYDAYTNVQWGNTVAVPKASSKLPYDVGVEFSKDTSSSKRAIPVRLNPRVGGPVQCPQNWEQWLVKIQAGETTWDYSDTNSQQMPYCKVGGWDNSPFAGSGFQSTRDSDCFWNC